MSDGKCPDVYDCRLGEVVSRDLHQAIVGKLRDELFEAIKTTQTLRKQLDVAREGLEKLRYGPGNKMENWKRTWAHGFSIEILARIDEIGEETK